MDIHNNFDEFLDLRDQQEEGSVLQQHNQDNKVQSGQEEESIMNGMNEDNTVPSTTTATTNNNGATVSSWNLQGTGDSYLPHHDNNDTTTSSADAAAAAAAAAVVAGASVDPNQPFYFPLDTAGWASVFGTSEMNTAALTAFMHDNEHQQTTTTTAATTATVTNNTTDSDVSHFIPPQQMLLQQPTTVTEAVHDNANDDMDVDIPETVVSDNGHIANNNDNNDNGDDHDKTEKEEKGEEDTGRMRTRSSTRLRTTVTKPTTTKTKKVSASLPATTNQEEPKNDSPETPKKKTKVKKLYCVCQKPYNGDPMVQCDQCSQWFHCECVDLDPDEAEDIEIWVCKDCEAKQGKKDDKEAKQEDVPEKEKQGQEKLETKDEQTQERPYATRQSKVRKCLLPTCKNRTRADSYCSDVCAAKDTMRKSGDSDYEPTKSPSPPRERRSRTSSLSSSVSTSSTNTTTPTDKKSSTTSTTTTTSKQERSSSRQPGIAPEDDPIRKNVVKNMATVLKTIIRAALDKDPTLFVTATSSGNKDEAFTSQQEEQKQEEEEKSPEVMGDKIAHSIEQVMFKELHDTTAKRAGAQYKNKFRSLLHNLKDKANEGFQLRIITGELTPDDLVKMSSEDMANPELRSMSKSMRQESIKNSIMKHANVPIIKKTHKGDFIVIGTPDDEESNNNQQQRLSKEQQQQERPAWIQTGPNDILGDDSTSRKSSMSETPTTPVTIVSRNEREDEQRFEDILAKIGIGHRNSEQKDDDENNNGSTNKRSNTANGMDQPKKRKVEIDMEELLGEDDYQPEFGMDEDENDNNKDSQQQNNLTESGSTTPPFPSSSSPPSSSIQSSQKPPTIWNGRVNMPQVAEFDACARQIGGRTLSAMEWSEVLSPTMWIEGRIPVDRVTQYVTQTQYATSREIVLLEIEATDAKNYQNAQTLIKYFDSRKRFGVVGHNKTKIKDFYLIPLYKVQQLPDCLYVVRVEETQRDADMFLGVLVIQKPQEQHQPPEKHIPPAVSVTPSVHTPTPPPPLPSTLPIQHQYPQQQQLPFSQQYQIPPFVPPQQQKQQQHQQHQQHQYQRQRQPQPRSQQRPRQRQRQDQYQRQRQRQHQHQHQTYNPSTMYYHPPAP